LTTGDETTDDPVVADNRNLYKIELRARVWAAEDNCGMQYARSAPVLIDLDQAAGVPSSPAARLLIRHRVT